MVKIPVLVIRISSRATAKEALAFSPLCPSDRVFGLTSNMDFRALIGNETNVSLAASYGMCHLEDDFAEYHAVDWFKILVLVLEILLILIGCFAQWCIIDYLKHSDVLRQVTICSSSNVCGV